jgi:hypothetical protein
MKNTRFLRIIATFLLLFLFTNPALASISKNEYDKLKEEFLDVFRNMETAREATFWDKHKWKIVTGAVNYCRSPRMVVIASSSSRAPAVISSVATPAYVFSTGSVAVLSSSVIAFLTAGGVALVVLGAKFSKEMLEKDGAKFFLNSTTLRYVYEKGIKLTNSDKSNVIYALKQNEKEILKSSTTISDVFKKMDQIAFRTLLECLPLSSM